MQKLLRRTAQAERAVARRQEKAKAIKAKGESFSDNQTRLRQIRTVNQRLRDDRINRRIDWNAGSLAPRRDLSEIEGNYGAIPIYDLQPPDKDRRDRPEWAHIAIGDRVVMTRGRDRGKIGVVDDVNLDKAAVQVKNMNMVNVVVPDWMQQESGDDVRPEAQPAAQYVSLNSVKLVYPLPDEKTGVPRDVIIRRVDCINRKWNRTKKEWDRGDRVVKGTNTIIPWPEEADPVHEDHDDDTLRISVDEQTFRPFLIRPPMPLSVIDELRNKYSKFRTRHDHEYLEKKELEDLKEEQTKGLINTMNTPLQELAALRAQQKEAQQQDLTSDQLAKIGEVIAQERARTGSTPSAAR